MTTNVHTNIFFITKTAGFTCNSELWFWLLVFIAFILEIVSNKIGTTIQQIQRVALSFAPKTAQRNTQIKMMLVYMSIVGLICLLKFAAVIECSNLSFSYLLPHIFFTEFFCTSHFGFVGFIFFIETFCIPIFYLLTFHFLLLILSCT